LEELAIASGAVAELVKKAFRDNNGAMGQDKIYLLRKALKRIIDLVSWLSHYYCQMTLEDVAEENRKKLRSRADRGTLQGEGDER